MPLPSPGYGHVQPPVYTDIPNYSRAPYEVVAGAVCNQCLAVVQRINADAHTQWHDNQRKMTMSTVLWCDAGDHAFKAGRPGSQSVQGTEINEDGMSVSVQQDKCPECVQASRQQRMVRELETVTPEDCPACEKKALVWNKHAGANQCMMCGWNSNDVQSVDVNKVYGDSASRYMSDDK